MSSGFSCGSNARIRGLFGEVRGAEGARKQDAFNELRGLLAVHETAEEMIVRPAAKDTAGEDEAHARNAEEREANKVLAEGRTPGTHAGAAGRLADTDLSALGVRSRTHPTPAARWAHGRHL